MRLIINHEVGQHTPTCHAILNESEVIPISRNELMHQINQLTDNHCSVCLIKEELGKQHGTAFCYVDSYCNKQCSIGQQLQALGKQLDAGEKYQRRQEVSHV